MAICYRLGKDGHHLRSPDQQMQLGNQFQLDEKLEDPRHDSTIVAPNSIARSMTEEMKKGGEGYGEGESFEVQKNGFILYMYFIYIVPVHLGRPSPLLARLI
jgi:hypothetical protein